MFSRLGTWCHDHRKLVLVALDRRAVRRQRHRRRHRRRLPPGLLARRASSRPRASRSSSRSSTTAAARRSRARSSSRPSRASTTPRCRRRWRRCSPRWPTIDDVTAVQSPYAPGGEFQISSRGDAAGRIAYATVNLPEDIDFTRASDIGDEIRDLIPDDRGAARRARRLPVRRVRAAVGRAVRPGVRHHHPDRGLRVGARHGPAGRPSALFGIGMGGAFVILASHLMEVPDFAPFVGLMIGLGVGIDYALLIVTRYREQLHAGHDVRESVAIAMDTAGRSVAVRRRHGRDLAARHAAHGHRLRRRARHHRVAHGRRHGRRVDHAAPRAARLRRREDRAHQVAGPRRGRLRRRRPRRRRPQDPRARRRRLRARRCSRSCSGSSSRRCKREVPHRPPKPRRETVAYRWSRVIQHRPWTVGDRGAGRPARPGHPGAPACASGSPTRATSPTTPPPSRPTTSSSTASARARPVRSTSSPTVDGAEQVGALAAVNEAVAADPDVESVLGPQPNDPDEPDRGPLARDPARRPAGRVDDRARQPPARRRPARRSRSRRAPTCSSAGSSPPTSTCRPTWASACRSSSAPCSRCRSCC